MLTQILKNFIVQQGKCNERRRETLANYSCNHGLLRVSDLSVFKIYRCSKDGVAPIAGLANFIGSGGQK